jgi:hypothetical protein
MRTSGAATGRDESAGAMVNARTVLRRGALVERPAPYNAPAIHAHLLALRQHGFEAAPTPISLTADGREQLTFIPGDVAVPPYPAWALTTDSLVSVGKLLRRMHEAAAAIAIDTRAEWSRDLADPYAEPAGGVVLCHNDVSMGNVVFQDGQAIALIDFDMMAPGRPLWDVAVAARYWAILANPASAPARLRVLADSYGLSARQRAELPVVVEQVTETCRTVVAARVADGDPQFVKTLAERGGWERWDRMQAWLAANRSAFTAALLD